MAARSVEFWPSLEMNFSGIGCTLEAKTTQLSVIFLLAISKKYTVSGVTFSFNGLDDILDFQLCKGTVAYAEDTSPDTGNQLVCSWCLGDVVPTILAFSCFLFLSCFLELACVLSLACGSSNFCNRKLWQLLLCRSSSLDGGFPLARCFVIRFLCYVS